VNADAKLVVDPCKDRLITDFIGQDEIHQIQQSQADSIEKVESRHTVVLVTKLVIPV
jgi:hypothetical protein